MKRRQSMPEQCLTADKRLGDGLWRALRKLPQYAALREDRARFQAWLESTRLELERGADVDRLAVAAIVLESRHAVALDIVANATGQRDAA